MFYYYFYYYYTFHLSLMIYLWRSWSLGLMAQGHWFVFMHKKGWLTFPKFWYSNNQLFKRLKFLWDWSKINSIFSYSLKRRIYFFWPRALIELVSIFVCPSIRRKGNQYIHSLTCEFDKPLLWPWYSINCTVHCVRTYSMVSTTEYTEWHRPLSGVIYIMMETLAHNLNS
jgi:hypothetical protein